MFEFNCKRCGKPQYYSSIYCTECETLRAIEEGNRQAELRADDVKQKNAEELSSRPARIWNSVPTVSRPLTAKQKKARAEEEKREKIFTCIKWGIYGIIAYYFVLPIFKLVFEFVGIFI